MRFLLPIKGSIQNPSYSPDGKQFVFTRYRNGYGVGAADLYLCSIIDREKLVLLTGGELQGRVNANGSGYLSTWHASGWIAFSSDVGGETPWPCKIKADGTGFQFLLPREGNSIGINPTFAPNGWDFAFEKHVPALQNDIPVDCSEIVVKCADSRPMVFGGGLRMRRPSWSPNGKYLSFEVLHDTGKCMLGVMEIGTDKTTCLTSLKENFCSATWAPDSDKLLCVGPGGAIFEVDLKGRFKPLYNLETGRLAFLGSPVWCPDGSARRRRVLCEGCDRDSPEGGPGSWLEIF